MQGIIGLDIDGTLTTEANSMPRQVMELLHELAQQWQLVFITGRSFTFGTRALNKLDVEYTVVVQNGATILHMPGKKVIFRNYLHKEDIPFLENCAENKNLNLLVEGGIELDDKSYYCPKGFDLEEKEYFKLRENLGGSPFIALQNFEQFPRPQFPLIKIFGPEKRLQALKSEVLKQKELTISIVHDPFRAGFAVGLITAKGVDKGVAFSHLLKERKNRGKIIVAGDDENDRELLKLGDVRIVMETAPPSLKAIATMIAPPAREMGIIKALKEATCQ